MTPATPSGPDREPLTVGVTPPWDLWQLDPGEQRARFAAIADAGLDHVFTADHVSFRGGHGIDGVVRLAALSGVEPRLGLHLGVFLLALRHPMVAARQIATLAESAPGRLVVGVGVGGEDRHEIELCEIDPTTRGRRTDVALDLVRRLLAGDEVDGDGEFYRFERGRILPVPAPPVPLLVGGRSDAALDRAGRLGDGWLATWCSATRFGEGVQRVEALAPDRRRPWQHGLQLWAGVGRDADEGRRHVSAAMERFYRVPFDAFERYTPVGTPDQIADFLRPYVQSGVSNLNLTPCGPDRTSELAAIAAVADLLRPC